MTEEEFLGPALGCSAGRCYYHPHRYIEDEAAIVPTYIANIGRGNEFRIECCRKYQCKEHYLKMLKNSR